MSPHPQPTDLAAHRRQIQDLARRTTRDPHLREDLTQDALLLTLDPATLSLPSSWWSTLLRNLHLTRLRSDRRRARRERQSARSEATPSTLDLLERESDRLRLLAALDSLPEPYNSTLHRRFLDGLSARELARRDGIPESTVATRSAEGLRRLRSILARGTHQPGSDECDARRRSARLLLLSPRPPGSSARAALSTALTMSSSIKLLLAGGALLALLFGLRGFERERAPLAAGEVVLDTLPDELAAATPLTTPPASRSEVSALPADPEESAFVHPDYAPANFPARPVHGRVVDLAGRVVPGIEICRHAFSGPRGMHPGSSTPTHCATSDGRGEFELELRPPCALRVRSERYATVYEALVQPGRADETILIVVAARIALGGRVVDERDEPVVGAVIAVHPADRQLELPGNLLASSSLVMASTRSDEQGAFEFEEAARFERAELFVSAAGFRARQLPYPSADERDLRIVLRRAEPDATTLTGRVVLPDERPAAGAWVSVGSMAVQTGAEGRFVIDLGATSWNTPPRDAPFEVFAALAGYQAGRATSPSIEAAERSGQRASLVLVLGGAPLELRGRVVDSAGEPLAGLAVRLFDPTPFGLVPDLRAGWSRERTVEDLVGGGTTRTDTRGEFLLGGLSQRAYRVEVMQRPSLLSATSESVQAGSEGLEIVLDVARAATLAGLVLDRDGRPVDGVRVAVSRKWPGSLEIGAQATTDVRGRFRIEAATPAPVYLRLEGDAIVPELFRELDADTDPSRLELVVARRCWLQVDWGLGDSGADELFVVDEAGVRLELMSLEGNGVSPRSAIRAGKGLSGVYAVSDSATEVVLRRAGEELARHAIRPTPGEVYLVRL